MIRSIAARAVVGGLATLTVVACGGDADTAPAPEAAAEPAQAATAATPVTPTGNVIEVTMATTMGGGSGEYRPGEVRARRGDVVRFVNDGGVAHNVSFPAALNPGITDLPPPSPYLVEEGASHDVLIDMPAGTYQFQCDPHMMMGMTGTLVVED